MTEASDPVVIVSFARTPMGGFQGVLSGVKATANPGRASACVIQASVCDGI